MRAVVQRVTRARVTVGGEVVAAIDEPGLVVLVEVSEPGELLVPADKLRDIVRESVDDTLSIELSGNEANIRGQDSHFKIYTQSPAEFPPVPDFEGEAMSVKKRRRMDPWQGTKGNEVNEGANTCVACCSSELSALFRAELVR